MQTRTITINIRKKLMRLHRNRRRQRISGIVREEAARLTKSEPESITISKQLNEALLKGAQGSSFMLARVAVSVEQKDGGMELRLPAPAAPAQAPAPAKAAAPKKEEKKQLQAPKQASGKPKE